MVRNRCPPILLVLGCSVVLSTDANAQAGELETLRKHAESIGCGAVAESSFAFGYRSEGDKFSAVYWCDVRGDGAGSKLVIWFDAALGLAPCAPLELHNPAQGIALMRAEGRSLSEFVMVKGRWPGPANHRASGAVIRASHDGVTEDFYCHGGVWFIGRSAARNRPDDQ
jgi:hypothetical protein